MGERYNGIVEVVGSIPSGSTKTPRKLRKMSQHECHAATVRNANSERWYKRTMCCLRYSRIQCQPLPGWHLCRIFLVSWKLYFQSVTRKCSNRWPGVGKCAEKSTNSRATQDCPDESFKSCLIGYKCSIFLDNRSRSSTLWPFSTLVECRQTQTNQ